MATTQGLTNTSCKQLVHLQVHKRQADKASKDEQSRRVEELSHLSEEEIQHRMAVANKLFEVQKELLSIHTPVKVLSLCTMFLIISYIIPLANRWLPSS